MQMSVAATPVAGRDPLKLFPQPCVSIMKEEAAPGSERELQMSIRTLLAVTAALSASTLSAAPADTVDEIVSKHIAAMGGAEKIRAIRTSKMTGKMVVGGGQTEARMVTYTSRPKQTRMDVDIQGQKIVQAFDGTTSWTINPGSGSNDPQRAPADESRAAATDADPDGSPLLDYKAKGTTIELLGKEEVEGAPAHKLKVTLKSGTVSTIFIDEKTFLTSKIMAKRKQMGQEIEVENYPRKYKAVDGVQMPFSTETKVGGRSMVQIVVEQVETNIPIDAKMFAFPVKEAPVVKEAPKQ
jgi:outer membrane lipoprotein-sorting protein